MGKLAILLLISLQLNVSFAGEIDNIEAAALVSELMAPVNSECVTIPLGVEGRATENNESAMYAVSASDAKYDRVIKVRVNSPEEIPAEIRQFIPGQVFDRSKDGKIDVVLSLPNDNAGMGLWGVVTGNDTGDDFGATHGLKLDIGKDVDGYYYKGSYETNLYTQRAGDWSKNKNGKWTTTQFFTEENILNVDNQNKGNVTFWQAGAGAIELNSEETRGWLFASGQQKGFHRAMGAWEVHNVSDGRGIRRGAFVEGTVGRTFADHVFRGNQVRLRTTGEISGTLSSIEDGSSVTARGTAEGFYQKREGSLAYKATFGVETVAHQTTGSPTTNVSAGFGVAGRSMGAQLVMRQTVSGARQNYVNYNMDRGRTYTLEFFKKFGRGRGSNESVSFGNFPLKKD